MVLLNRDEVIKALNAEIDFKLESNYDLTLMKAEFQRFAKEILKAQEKAIYELKPASNKIMKEEAKRLYNEFIVMTGLKYIGTTCENKNEDYAECDQFVCSNCGIELQDWNRVERDEDDGDITYHEYGFDFCPHCGCKVVREK